jgi:flagellar protein FlaI
LENEPINVPRAMVQSLDMLSIQTLTRSGDQRVRRAKTIGEIVGIDQRTGELDYSSAFDWNAEADEFRRNDSSLMSEIADERGWSRAELLREIRRRERFLELLLELDIADYRTFTALVNEYYADPGRVMERLEDRARNAAGAEVPDEATVADEARRSVGPDASGTGDRSE